MRIVELFLINFFIFIANGDLIRESTGRIVGGRRVPIEEVPYQVSVQLDDRHKCGGSLISENYVLTAAHCVSANVHNFSIRTGTSNRQNGGKVYKVVNIMKHDYKMSPDGMPMNDIALLEVDPPFKFENACAPVSLFHPEEEALPGSIALISGWGQTLNNSRSFYLEAAEVPIVSKKDCRKAYKNLPEGEICAMYSLGGRDSCLGDSGGPLVIEGRLAGIISWGFGCGIKGKPGVYTEVAYYAYWIRKNS